MFTLVMVSAEKNKITPQGQTFYSESKDSFLLFHHLLTGVNAIGEDI